MTGSGNYLIKVDNLKKTFTVGSQQIEVIKGISLNVSKGDFAILFGPSGCGKSTLLHIMIGLEYASSGKIIFDDQDFGLMKEDQIVSFRKENVGVVFQQAVWVKSLNVLDNVSMPNRLRGLSKEEAEKKSMECLAKVGMTDWANYHPSELSSGQQQRVALARALTTDPLVIVADEPTGNLDTVSGDELMKLLLDLNKTGTTILMITHDLEYMVYASRLFHILDGLLVEELDKKGASLMSKKIISKKGTRGKLSVLDKNYLKENGNHYK